MSREGILDNFVSNFNDIAHDAGVALQTQIGDSQRLRPIRDRAFRLLTRVSEVRTGLFLKYQYPLLTCDLLARA